MQAQTPFLPIDILTEYINNFYGYGQWKADFWFVGIEEGGGDCVENIENRLDSWSKLGNTDLIDCYDHHRNTRTFRDTNKTKLHTQTWTKLIITMLNIVNKEHNKNEIINVQLKQWGIKSSNNLLIELLPLSSPGIGIWHYSKWVNLNSNLFFLKDRKSYERYIIPQRIKYIKSQIALFQPKLVLFYGSSRKQEWDKIIGQTIVNQEFIGRYKIYIYKIEQTLFVQCPQPNYVRPYYFWIALGKRISELL